jgi:hypothetical protein
MFLHPSQIQQFHIQNPKILKNTTNSIKISTLSKVSRHYKKKKKKDKRRRKQVNYKENILFLFVLVHGDGEKKSWREN